MNKKTLKVLLKLLISVALLYVVYRKINFGDLVTTYKTTNIAFSQCLDGVKNSVDRELQTWINNQVFILEDIELATGRSSALVMFKRSQSNFITFRENNCRWQYLAISPGTGAGPAYKKCYIKLSKIRIQELSQIN